jgi:hypothetical protein
MPHLVGSGRIQAWKTNKPSIWQKRYLVDVSHSLRVKDPSGESFLVDDSMELSDWLAIPSWS